GPRGGRHGWRGVGGHGARRRRRVQDVLPPRGPHPPDPSPRRGPHPPSPSPQCGEGQGVRDEPGAGRRRRAGAAPVAGPAARRCGLRRGRRGKQRARAEPFDLILCDVRMADMDGIAFLRAYKSGGGPALVIMMSAYGGEEAALAAMKEGAYDYVAKPFRPDEVVLTLRKAEERERLGYTIATLRAQLDSSPAARALVAESPAMRHALDIVARVAG